MWSKDAGSLANGRYQNNNKINSAHLNLSFGKLGAKKGTKKAHRVQVRVTISLKLICVQMY